MTINNIAIEIEGVDKAGKDTIGPYITTITNYAYAVNCRGALTQVVYNDKFHRNHDYVMLYKPLVVFLDVSNDDHQIRCAISHEPKININKDREAYYRYIEEFEKLGITVLKFNTSEKTPMQIAKEVNEYLKTTKAEDYLMTEPVVIKPLGFYNEDDLKNEDVFYEFKPEENK